MIDFVQNGFFFFFYKNCIGFISNFLRVIMLDVERVERLAGANGY